MNIYLIERPFNACEKEEWYKLVVYAENEDKAATFIEDYFTYDDCVSYDIRYLGTTSSKVEEKVLAVERG